MILDFIGWNLCVVSFICFLYVATVQKQLTLSEALPLLIPILMVIGGIMFGVGTKSITSDLWLSRKEFFDGVLWFTVVFGAIATVHVGVVEIVSHTPFNVTYNVMDLKVYGILIAIAEEIFFRGFLLPWLSTMGYPLGQYIGVPASAGAWTLFHLGVYGTQPQALILVLMVGIILGFIAWYKKRLWIFMGAHALVNFMAMGGIALASTILPAFLVGIVLLVWALSRGRRQ